MHTVKQHYLHIAIKMHENIDECYLHIRPGTLHGVRSKRSHIGRCKKHTLGRLQKGSLKKANSKAHIKKKKQIKGKDGK